VQETVAFAKGTLSRLSPRPEVRLARWELRSS
jgi:hypothetical protein